MSQNVVSVIVVNFSSLLGYWSEWLENAGKAATQAKEPVRTSRFADASRGVHDCLSILELIGFLESGSIPYDRELKRRVAVMRQCNNSCRWLNGKVSGFLRDWYAQYSEDGDSTRRIAGWIDELAAAYGVWVNGDGSPRFEPQTGNWHDNQCAAWSELIRGETPNGSSMA